MKKVIGFLKKKWVISLIGLLALVTLIWFAFPLITFGETEPFADTVVRLTLVLMAVTVWGAFHFYRQMKLASQHEKMFNELDEKAKENKRSLQEQDDESKRLQKRMSEAVKFLKGHRFQGKKKLFELPWYALIGAPGSGKTTAILNSGLSFPLQDKFGQSRLQGVGGTRNCDWWFTDHGVLLDTAGRYTTQDSQAAVDRAGWKTFIHNLRSNRPKQPLNGIILTISVQDILQMNQVELINHCETLRNRIMELRTELSMRFPIYVFFTKIDLLSGFKECFENLTQEERAQPWGQLVDEGVEPKSAFISTFHDLQNRLQTVCLKRLHYEGVSNRKPLIYEFPHQLASVESTLAKVIEEVFLSSQHSEKIFLRGIFLASGAQVGHPFDRVFGRISERLKIPSPNIETMEVPSKGYFLFEPFKDLIFKESHIASVNKKFKKQQSLLKKGTLVASAVATVLMMVGLGVSYFNNKSFIDSTQKKTVEIEKSLIPDYLLRKDILSIEKALTELEKLRFGVLDKDKSSPIEMSFGLFQGDKIGEGHESLYKRAMETHLAPYLKRALEDKIAVTQDKDFLFTSLQTYLMFYMPTRMNSELVLNWFQTLWLSELPGEANAETRESLIRHLKTFVAEGFVLDNMNTILVRKARNILKKMPVDERVYRQFKLNALQSGLKPFVLSYEVSSEAAEVFKRGSGRDVDEPIPAFFTKKGFFETFLKGLEKLVTQVAESGWVIGEEESKPLTKEEVKEISAKVKKRYNAEYTSTWEKYLKDLEIRDVSHLGAALKVVGILADANSPLKELLVKVRKNTMLTRKPSIGINTPAIPKIPIDVRRKMPGYPVEKAFRRLNRVTDEKSASASIKTVMTALTNYHNFLIKISNNPDSVKISPSNQNSPGAKLKVVAKRQPQPLQSWVLSLVKNMTSVLNKGAKEHIKTSWVSDVVPHYKKSLKGRYPLNKSSFSEAPLEDFVKFFSYGGILEQFYNDNLKDFVDDTKKPWTWKTDVGLKDSFLATIERGSEIREMFFQPGGKKLHINFSIKPVDLDSTASQILFDVGAHSLSYRHGPPRSVKMGWTGEEDVQRARVLMVMRDHSQSLQIVKEGPWAFFRLLDKLKLSKTNQSELFRLEVNLKDKIAIFELRAQSVYNPFQSFALNHFKIPEVL